MSFAIHINIESVCIYKEMTQQKDYNMNNQKTDTKSPLKKKCLYCKKPLVKIGLARHNGALHKDWSTRQYHKKCWKELKGY